MPAIASAPPTPVGPFASFLAAAVDARDDGSDRDGHDSDTVDGENEVLAHEPPFWMSATGAEPTYPSGTPVIDPTTHRITYLPEPATANHPAGSAGAFVQQLQAQLTAAQAQLAATTVAWRRERVGAIAAQIAVEALVSGTLPQFVTAARDAAQAAAAALTDDELRREDGYPQAVARGAGVAAAQQLGAAIAWQAQQAPWPSPRDPNDELSRARARRRSRSQRW